MLARFLCCIWGRCMKQRGTMCALFAPTWWMFRVDWLSLALQFVRVTLRIVCMFKQCYFAYIIYILKRDNMCLSITGKLHSKKRELYSIPSKLYLGILAKAHFWFLIWNKVISINGYVCCIVVDKRVYNTCMVPVNFWRPTFCCIM